MKITEICEEIKKPISEFNIRNLIITTSPPFEWAGIKDHPIHKIGYYYFGISDRFNFQEEKISQVDENLLWKLYALIQNYWLIHYEEWNGKTTNMVFNMRNNIKVIEEDINKDLLSVYEKYYNWR